jgi:hypothetical protein
MAGWVDQLGNGSERLRHSGSMLFEKWELLTLPSCVAEGSRSREVRERGVSLGCIS